MPFSLKEFNLKPNALYRVSLVLNQGDKEVDSLRSFYSKTPQFFTKNLSDFVSYPLIKTGVIPTPAIPPTTSGGTDIFVKMDKISWKLVGSLKKSAVPKYNFTLTLKKQGTGKKAKTVNFSNQVLEIQVGSSNAWIQRILKNMVTLGALSAKNGKITFTIDAVTMGLTLETTGSGFNTKYQWFSDRVAWLYSDSINPKKDFVQLKYTTGVTTTPGTPAYQKTSKSLTASVNTSIYSELVDEDEVKDIIFWLYSDIGENAPTSITDGGWKFLDFGFSHSIGNLTGWTRATGQNIYVSTNNYYLPSYSDLGIFPYKHNGVLESIKVFDNGDSGQNIQPSETQAPTYFYVCFTIVRFTLKNNVWTSQWLVEELGNSNVPQISQIMTAGVS
jgi:hypothetical protein